MSSTSTPQAPLGLEEYARLPDDGFRSELVRGRVVREPQPTVGHGEVQARLAELLRRHIRQSGGDLVCASAAGVITSESPPTVRGPDLMVIRGQRMRDLHRSGFLRGAPDLAIEIISPGNAAAEIQEKVTEYLESGASAVWVIYPGRRIVAVHASVEEARFHREGDDLPGGSLLPELRLPVTAIFTD